MRTNLKVDIAHLLASAEFVRFSLQASRQKPRYLTVRNCDNIETDRGASSPNVKLLHFPPLTLILQRLQHSAIPLSCYSRLPLALSKS